MLPKLNLNGQVAPWSIRTGTENHRPFSRFEGVCTPTPALLTGIRTPCPCADHQPICAGRRIDWYWVRRLRHDPGEEEMNYAGLAAPIQSTTTGTAFSARPGLALGIVAAKSGGQAMAGELESPPVLRTPLFADETQ